ncbi:MAG: cell envelope integrity protein TolA [Yersiniaceae bacterium]|nr:cell envelope integrity protein TolA [Yersiniaceae bacterium]
MRIIILSVLTCTILSGCNLQGSTPKSAQKQLTTSVEHRTAVPPEIERYGAEIYKAVAYKFYSPKKYKGQRCTVRINLSPEGKVTNAYVENAHAEQNDAELCKAALLAVQQAEIPAPPSTEVWQTLKNVFLDFEPK